MSNNISKNKKEELILKMQGTKDNPRLKYVREIILKIKTAGELAEILDITRQTMSKIENCVNKLSGAQYLAICGLIEKNKNKELDRLDDGKTDVHDVIDYLSKISDFYDFRFCINILNLITCQDKKNVINELKKCTCLNKWLSCMKYNKLLSISEEEYLFRNGNILLLIEEFKDIVNLNNIFKRYKELEGDKNGIFAIEYNNIINVLQDIKNRIVYEKTFNKAAFDFIYNISSLNKNGKIKLYTVDNLGPIIIDNIQKKTVLLIQSYETAKKTKIIIETNNKHTNSANVFEKSLLLLEEIEFLKYENNHFERHVFDFEEIINMSNSYKLEDNIYYEKISSNKENNKLIYDIILDDKMAKEDKINKLDDFIISKDVLQKMENEMNNKLEEAMQECLNYLPSNI